MNKEIEEKCTLIWTNEEYSDPLLIHKESDVYFEFETRDNYISLDKIQLKELIKIAQEWLKQKK